VKIGDFRIIIQKKARIFGLQSKNRENGMENWLVWRVERLHKEGGKILCEFRSKIVCLKC